MSLFGLRKASSRFGAIIDIGSGSVLVAIIHSEPNKKYPQIIWSHREQAPLRNIDSLEQSAKAVMAALVNSSMLLDAQGRQALNEYRADAKLTEFQCSISAPWSYTVTKTINYIQNEEFLITNELISDLRKTIEDKIKNELKEDEALQNLGLQIIAKLIMNLTANGYKIISPAGNRTKSLAISQSNAVAQKYLIEAIDELHEKLFVQTLSRKLSFVLMLYSVTQDLLNQAKDVCLIDVTYEATEIGVVRDGILTYCTHTSFGIFSLTREIAEITSVPLHEALGYLHNEKPYSFMDNLNTSQRGEVEKVFEAYVEKISELFKETGDSLSIPKQISIHTDLNSETLLTDLIGKAAKRNLKTTPNITQISSEIINQYYQEQTSDTVVKIPTDTALLLSAQFFHNKAEHDTYEYF